MNTEDVKAKRRYANALADNMLREELVYRETILREHAKTHNYQILDIQPDSGAIYQKPDGTRIFMTGSQVHALSQVAR